MFIPDIPFLLDFLYFCKRLHTKVALLICAERMGGDAVTEMAFINALFFDGLESSTFKPLSKTKQWVDVPMMCLYASSLSVKKT